MSVRAHMAYWPLSWKVPLLAAGLLIGAALIISQIVLNRLEEDQENNLRLLTSAYLDGLSAAVLPSAIHADVWEAFDALDRARDHYAGLKVRFAIVALPNGKVLAASDPTEFPVQSVVPPDVDRRFPTEDGLAIDNVSGRAWLARSLREEGFSVGRILTEIDISELLRVRKQVLLTLIAVNAGLALGFAAIGLLALRRMLKPLSVLSGYGNHIHRGHAARRDRNIAHRPALTADESARAARSTFRFAGDRLPHRGTCAVRAGRRDGRPDWLHHASDPQFLRDLHRVRVTCTGRLYMCLGHEDAADLRTPLRASEGNGLLNAAIREAITRKPKGHDFIIDRSNRLPAVARHMSVTGG